MESVKHNYILWGTVPSVGNVAQPPLGKASGEQGWWPGPTSMYQSKIALLYYAKVCFGWLSFADKGEGVTEYIKGGYLQCKGKSGRKG